MINYSYMYGESYKTFKLKSQSKFMFYYKKS